jgi:tetratricopeptide (TPR) repeat protein
MCIGFTRAGLFFICKIFLWFVSVVILCPGVAKSSGQKPTDSSAISLIDSLNEKGLDYYRVCNYSLARECFNRALVISLQTDYKKGTGEGYFNIAEIQLETDLFDSAMHGYRKALEVFSGIGDWENELWTLNSMGICEKSRGEYVAAREFYRKAGEIAAQYKKSFLEAVMLNNMANIDKDQGNFARALESYSRALEMLRTEEREGDVSDILTNMGDVKKAISDTSGALECCRQSLAIALKLNDPYRLIQRYRNLAAMMTWLGHPDSARIFYNVSLELAHKVAVPSLIAECMLALGDYWLPGKPDSALVYYREAYRLSDLSDVKRLKVLASLRLASLYLETGQMDQAGKRALEAYRIGRSSDLLTASAQATEILFRISEKGGDYKKALEWHLLFKELEDRINLDLQNRLIRNYESRQELLREKEKSALLEAETLLLTQKIRQRTFLILFLVVLVILIFIILVLLTLRARYLKVLHEQQEQMNRQKVEELRLKVEGKERELTASLMNMNQRNQLIAGVVSRLESIRKTGSPGEVENLIRELKHQPPGTNWDEFDVHFTQVHPGFYERLATRYPGLSMHEQRLCTFLKMNLNTKEISSITGKSVKSIEVTRTRIRARMNLPRERSLPEELMGI